mgnify:CR=1 FL=1
MGKKTENKAVGVSRGGRNTKIHALVDGLGNPLAFLLSSGNDHDSKHAVPLLSQIDIEGSNILGDKAYGAKAIRDYIDSQEASFLLSVNCLHNSQLGIDHTALSTLRAHQRHLFHRHGSSRNKDARHTVERSLSQQCDVR